MAFHKGNTCEIWDNSTKKLLPEEATREIRGIAKIGSVIPSDHILYDHQDRNYDMHDVEGPFQR